jgi:diguanylate cyclase (GGDEF)-like protein
MGAEAGFTPSGLVTSLHKARNGTMYVGSNSELWNYSSYVSAAFITPPEVNLTELRVMNEVVASGYNLNGLTSKHLHSDEKIFRVSFEAVDYRYQGEISYQYRLMGLSDIWVNNGQNDSVTFANLAPGEYLFSVRAVNEFGDFSEKEASIKIVVEKSYWQRTPALIMYAVILAALFLTFLKIWEGRLMKAQISELEEARMKVVEANKKLSFLTMSDSLTGLLNRRGFDRGIAQALATAQRNSLMITLYMLDVDFFKLYNDNYGHVKGDEALRGVGKALRQVFGRSTDIIARYGGEEFAVVFVGENPNASVTLANDLILAVKELGIVHEFSSVSGLLTQSAGSATVRVDESDTVERLIQRADDALYAAKEGGRNRICFTGVIPELPGRMKSGLKPLVIDEGNT